MVSLGRGKTPHAVEPSCRDRHSERSEESRYMELVTVIMVNTCQQEGGGRGKPVCGRFPLSKKFDSPK